MEEEDHRMDETEWSYHGEGNKSLVVAHGQMSRVLRLLKYSSEDAENAPQNPEETFRQMDNIVDFSNNVMGPLLGDKFVHSGEVVKLPLEFVRQLSIKVQHQRPAWRCDKVMDIYSGAALCLPNLTAPPCLQTHTPPLCIEIKPKCGFLPSPEHVSKDIKTKVCRYCMHQHYKVANGKWKRKSLYCPLDLFSGNKQRMYFAIKHLIEEPQNNFKIFKGGQCIHGDREELPSLNSLVQKLRPYFTCGTGRNMTLLHDFIQVLVDSLLSSDEEGNEGVERRREERTVCEASLCSKELIRTGSQPLPRDSVLGRILQVQLLDSLDIEGVFPLYRRVEQHLHHFPQERGRLQVDGPYDKAFLEKLQKCPAEDDGSIEYAVAKVQQYRVAMTAKDCSIMVTLVPRRDEEDGGDRAVSSSVSILDLDPKPQDGVRRQQRLDHRVVSSYLRDAPGPRPPRFPECTLLIHPV
ncbi:hypothetical protein NHX12_030576 [Muraenolepis orangiensis]|uniref:Inositol-pentakisphosphate 2-kinase n=1 Tax=Muraenolepis orangiensis TaxID=630683 RepID=A0A9Q0ILS5_9TELE|nr:hypothetical protein NHX12_030576 [Muraenolepis orangiensis]